MEKTNWLWKIFRKIFDNVEVPKEINEVVSRTIKEIAIKRITEK